MKSLRQRSSYLAAGAVVAQTLVACPAADQRGAMAQPTTPGVSHNAQTNRVPLVAMLPEFAAAKLTAVQVSIASPISSPRASKQVLVDLQFHNDLLVGKTTFKLAPTLTTNEFSRETTIESSLPPKVIEDLFRDLMQAPAARQVSGAADRPAMGSTGPMNDLKGLSECGVALPDALDIVFFTEKGSIKLRLNRGGGCNTWNVETGTQSFRILSTDLRTAEVSVYQHLIATTKSPESLIKEFNAAGPVSLGKLFPALANFDPTDIHIAHEWNGAATWPFGPQKALYDLKLENEQYEGRSSYSVASASESGAVMVPYAMLRRAVNAARETEIEEKPYVPRIAEFSPSLSMKLSIALSDSSQTFQIWTESISEDGAPWAMSVGRRSFVSDSPDIGEALSPILKRLNWSEVRNRLIKELGGYPKGFRPL